MNTTRAVAVAAWMLAGVAAADTAEVAPAWSVPGFVMEEIVVTAEAPVYLYMEEIVVTAEAPAHLYMEEIVVTAEPPRIELTVAALDMPEIDVAAVPVMQDVVVSARREDVSSRLATRTRYSRNMRNVLHF